MGNGPSKKKAANSTSTNKKPKEPASTNTTPTVPHHGHEDKGQGSQQAHQVHHTHAHAPAASPAVGGDSAHVQTKVEDKGAFSNKKLEELFDKYKDKDNDEEQIGPDGIEQLCKDLGVDPEDVLVLVFAWHLNAQRIGFFSKEEFITGMQKLGSDSIAKLKNQLPNFKRDLDDQIKFKDIYRFAFVFAKERESKIIDLNTADALLALVLGSRYPHTEPLRQFLKEQTTYKSVNHDQWMNILEFSRSIKADLSNYDENSAWPVLLDEYCEWARKQLGKLS